MRYKAYGISTYNKDRKGRWSLAALVNKFEVKNQSDNDDEHEDDSSYDEPLFVHLVYHLLYCTGSTVN